MNRTAKIVLAGLLLSLILTVGSAQSQLTIEKSNATIYTDNNMPGVLDVGDIIKWTITISNPTLSPALIDVEDTVQTGLDNVTILTYPASVVYNPNSIGSFDFTLDSAGTNGPANPLPNMTVKSISSNSSFNTTGLYAGVFSGKDSSTNERYYCFCIEQNQSIGYNSYTMSVWHSLISAPIQDGKPQGAGQPITIQQKLMIQGIFHCLGVDTVRAMTSSSAQDLSIALGTQGATLKNLTNEQAAAAQIAIWEIVHETWTGPESISLTGGLISWQVRVSGTYQLPTSFINTFNSLISCATTYMETMSQVVRIADSTTKKLSIKHINIQPGATTTIEFTTVVTKEAINGASIQNTACIDVNADGVGDVCDSGETGPVVNGSISGYVWGDFDDDGVRDTGEPSFDHITITLTYAGADNSFGTSDDIVYPSQDTNPIGFYEFLGLPAGQFRIDCDENDLAPIYVKTTMFNPIITPLTLGENKEEQNFGYDSPSLQKSDASIWSDNNEIGVLDVGDKVAFTITVTNPSHTTSFSIDITDPLPTGLEKLDILSVPAGADITGSTATLLSVKNVVVPADGTATIIFNTEITADAPNGTEIVNTAYGDMNSDESPELSDPGSTEIVKNVETPSTPEDICSTVYVISTTAGTGKGGFKGEGTAATDAYLYYPIQTAIDLDDNLYIADYSNHVVRKIDAATGIISTYAGTPQTRGYSGDGGLAVNALLSFPSDVFVRGTNLYIAEIGNSVIRKVDMLTGVITTIAGTGAQGYSGDGGLAVNAQFDRPRSVFVDVAGNIYIADTFNFAIRKIDAVTGIISSIAGTGVAGHALDGELAAGTTIEWIHDLAMSSDGTLYFSEQNGYNLLRKIVNGRIYTIAGQAGNNSLGDCGPSAYASLFKPYGIAFDSYDNIYIADELNHKVRKIDALSGVITTIAGTGIAGYNGDNKFGVEAMLNNPTGVVVNSKNILYIVDRNNHRIRQMNLEDPKKRSAFPGVQSGFIDKIAGVAGSYGYNGDGSDARTFKLSYPGGIAVDVSGNVIVCDRSNHRIRKISTDWKIETIAGKGAPRGYSGDGGLAKNAYLNFPTNVVIDSLDNIYFSDQTNNVVRKIDTSGIITTVAGNGTAGFSGDSGDPKLAQLNEPEGLAIYDNKLYIADKSNNRIRVVDLVDPPVITTYAGNGSTGAGAENVPALSTALSAPRGISFAPDGTLYVAAFGAHKIKKITPAGNVSTFAGTGIAGYSGDGGQAAAAKINQPTDVCVSPSGNIYIADYRNHAVRMAAPSGIITTVAGTPGVAGYFGDGASATAARLNYPVNVAVNAAGDLFISDRNNHVIRAVGK